MAAEDGGFSTRQVLGTTTFQRQKSQMTNRAAALCDTIGCQRIAERRQQTNEAIFQPQKPLIGKA